MKCPQCNFTETKVLESRLSNDSRCIRRRRSCRRCETRFTTYEKEEEIVFHIKKKDGYVQPYSRQKAIRSIQIACQKRKIPIEAIEFMLGKIEQKFNNLANKLSRANNLDTILFLGYMN